MGITVPRLAKGKGFKGPDFYGCFNTGTAPAIFHSRTGKYVVGPESAAREAMSEGICLTNKRCYGKDRRKVWIFKGRGPAVARFMVLCGVRILENCAGPCRTYRHRPQGRRWRHRRGAGPGDF